MNVQVNSQFEHKLLYALLGLFAIAATFYSVVTPLFEMSDELWHYPMVKTLADGNSLPIQDGQNPGPWKQEGSQPPLYYYLAAVSTAGIDTSDVNTVLRPNPHVDNGVITLDGNNNLVVHNVDRERWPWYGSVLAVHIARLLSVIFGAGAVYFTYRIGVTVFPSQSWLALAGSAAVAFTPMFVFISGAVNNDSMSVMLASCALWIMMQITQQAGAQSTLRLAILLGAILGCAALTKTSTLGLFGLAGIAMAYTAWRAKRWQTFFIEGPIILLIASCIAGWWYVRNFTLYGDPLGLSAMIEVLGQRARPASLLQLWGERFGFMQSYWGLFGGVNIPMPNIVYDVLNTFAVVSCIGVAIVFIERLRRDGSDLHKWMPALLSILWIAGVVLPLSLSWARITWSSQGRLVFAAISCISLWFIAGISGVFPKRFRPFAAASVLAFMASITLASPTLWIMPRYAVHAADVAPDHDNNAVAEFGPSESPQPIIRLVDYEIVERQAKPGDLVHVRLTWESLARSSRNWSVFVHLEDTAQVLAGQRDMYPGQGLIATQDLPAGKRWTDEIVIPISASAYAPEKLKVKVGLYDYASCPFPCERMVTSSGQDSVVLQTIELTTQNSDLPNPVAVNFSDELALVGYELSSRLVQAGDSITVTLYWQGLREMTTNYSVSVQILDSEGGNFGQRDSWPMEGLFPTSAWSPNHEVIDPYLLTINEDTVPGVYNLQVVVYAANDQGNIDRLQRVLPDGRLVDDFLILTQIRVLP